MSAKTYDITIEQGATFKLNVTWLDEEDDPIDLTGFSARMQVRRKYTDPDTILSLSSANTAIVLGGAAGTIDITISAETTSQITAKCGVYDLELQSAGGEVTRLLEGSVTVRPEVTR